MIKQSFGCNGCLLIIFIFFIFAFLFKFWLIIFLVIIALLYFSQFKDLIVKVQNTFFNKEYENKPGKVYKICNFCSTKADRNAIICKNCQQPFEK